MISFRTWRHYTPLWVWWVRTPRLSCRSWRRSRTSAQRLSPSSPADTWYEFKNIFVNNILLNTSVSKGKFGTVVSFLSGMMSFCESVIQYFRNNINAEGFLRPLLLLFNLISIVCFCILIGMKIGNMLSVKALNQTGPKRGWTFSSLTNNAIIGFKIFCFTEKVTRNSVIMKSAARDEI